MAWDPERYEQFKKERFAPFDDLLRLVRTGDGLRIVDLGCGTGELTRRLADALPASEVVGIDSSPEMLAKTAAFARPGLRFELRRIEELEGEWDRIVSNAALHWVDDHAHLLPTLISHLRAGGQLAIQLPSNFGHVAHRSLDEISLEPPFAAALGAMAEAHRAGAAPAALPIDRYAEILHAAGATEITAFEKVYPHVLPDADAIVDFMSGTALLPYRARLDETLGATFVETFRRRLRDRFPGSPVLFTFRRTFIAATRPAGSSSESSSKAMA